ncbi:MAG TPA: valine--tRNA ligase, partial [Gammaproteobacteria bacterium]|nr:valine--tRNA ligase [Gammaproteobacteria bacterium]
KNLIGRMVDLPLTGRQIPVIADDYVDPEFGSGCVKITPAHDFNDYAVGQRHDLPLINILTINATLNEEVPEKYRGMDRYTARKQIISDLEKAGLLEKTEQHKLMVPRGDRSGAVIEPYLTDQWYVKVTPLAMPAIRAVEKGDIRFVPDNWSKTYFDWMCNIEDWCISRQLWWGHQIPAWYDGQGNIYVGESEAEIREREKLGRDVSLRQDEDVLDTWFSSALWPFSTLDWPEQSPELNTFYPTSVLVTGFDIIFFWVARMIMMALKFTGEVPFREVYVHGLVRDADGQKMSKSKGNILDPLDLIDGIELESLVDKRTRGLMRPQDAEKIARATRRHFPDGIESYGTDSLRFTFAALATQGRDIRFDVGRIQGYRNFCNKLWNASRYVMMNIEGQTLDINNGDITLGLAERWIYTRLAVTIEKVSKAIGTYRFDLASQALHEFTWDEYCDWYLELSKTTLNDDAASKALKRGTLHTLVDVLETLLRLLHPFIPFITEELWLKVAPLLGINGDTIMLQLYPLAADYQRDDDSITRIEWLKSFILGVRRIRAERDIAPGKVLSVSIMGGNPEEKNWLVENESVLKSLARIDTISEVSAVPDDAVIALAGDMTLLVPLADLIDLEAEMARLQKEQQKLFRLHEASKNKLANAGFMERAPREVVEKEQAKLDESAATLAKITKEINRLEALIGNN